MADKKISDFTAATTLASGDLIEIETAGGNSRKVTVANAGLSFGMAMVKKTADQTGANYSAGAMIAWDGEIYDFGGWHDNVTNNSRLTVPSGVSYVQVGVDLRFVNVTAASTVQFLLSKNGSSTFDGAVGYSDTNGLTNPRYFFVSGPIPVTGGTDYFEVNLTCTDTSIDITASVSNFWIRALG